MNTHTSVRYHQHFRLTDESITFLTSERENGTDERVEFFDSFWDTTSFDLCRSSYWLYTRDGEWRLDYVERKSIVNNEDENVFVVHTETESDKIIARLARKLKNRDPLPDETMKDFCPHNFAYYTTSRYTFHTLTECTFHVDIAHFAEDLFYNVATIERPPSEPNTTESEFFAKLGTLQPCASKIIAYISYMYNGMAGKIPLACHHNVPLDHYCDDNIFEPFSNDSSSSDGMSIYSSSPLFRSLIIIDTHFGFSDYQAILGTLYPEDEYSV